MLDFNSFHQFPVVAAGNPSLDSISSTASTALKTRQAGKVREDLIMIPSGATLTHLNATGAWNVGDATFIQVRYALPNGQELSGWVNKNDTDA